MDVTCLVDGCDHDVERKGYCLRHYMRQWRHGTTSLVGPQPKPCARCGIVFQPVNNRAVYCSIDCRRDRSTCQHCGTTFVVASGATGQYCSRDCWYLAERSSKSCPICSAAFRGSSKTCSKPCGYALRRLNHPVRRAVCEYCGTEIVGKKPHIRYCSRSCSMMARNNSAGGRSLPDGTRRSHAQGYIAIKHNGTWVAEHRLVVERQIGRPLLPHERVHHKNGKRDDNDPENLELWRIKGKDPAGVRASDYHCPGCRCGELLMVDQQLFKL